MTHVSVKRALRFQINYESLMHVERLADSIRHKVSCLRVLERSRISDARHQAQVEPYVRALSESLVEDLESIRLLKVSIACDLRE